MDSPYRGRDSVIQQCRVSLERSRDETVCQARLVLPHLYSTQGQQIWPEADRHQHFYTYKKFLHQLTVQHKTYLADWQSDINSFS